MPYENDLFTIDASYLLSGPAKKFDSTQIMGDHCMIQLNGTALSGKLGIEQSPDNSTWSKLRCRDGSLNYNQQMLIIDGSLSSSIELIEYTPKQYIRLSLDASGSGVLSNIKIINN